MLRTEQAFHTSLIYLLSSEMKCFTVTEFPFIVAYWPILNLSTLSYTAYCPRFTPVFFKAVETSVLVDIISFASTKD